jgi:hypothetical protein
MLRSDRTRRTRAQPAEPVRLEHGDELRPLGREEVDDECRSVVEAGVDLRACVAELEVRRRHVCQPPLAQLEPPARCDVHDARGHASEARFDSVDGIRRRQERFDVVFREEEGQAANSS